MTDIVEKLRSDGEDERQRFRESRCTLAPLLNEAAAEIERLRAMLNTVQNIRVFQGKKIIDLFNEIESLRALEKAGKARKKASQRLVRAALEEPK
jgi:hypothetical protein